MTCQPFLLSRRLFFNAYLQPVDVRDPFNQMAEERTWAHFTGYPGVKFDASQE